MGETVLDSFLALSKKNENNTVVTNKTVALQMFRVELEKAINNGTETFDRHKYLVTYPNALNLDVEKAHSLIREIVKTIESLVYQYRMFPQKVTWDDKYEVNNVY